MSEVKTGVKTMPRFKMYQQVYFAVITALAILGLITFALLHFIINPANRNTVGYSTFAKMVAESLPAADSPQSAQAAVVQQWISRSRCTVALYDPTRKLIYAGGSETLAAPRAAQTTDGWVSYDENIYAKILPDKRWVVVNMDRNETAAHVTIDAALSLIFILVGLGIYPVLRKITRRLDNLQRGVAELGEGNLSARVNIEGDDEVGVLAASFNRTAAQLETMVNAQKSLLANASHELRSPLARIQMALGLLQGDMANPANPAVEEIHRSVRELDLLIGEILLSSRLESGKMLPSLNLEVIALKSFLLDECAASGAQISSEELNVYADRVLLKRVLRNLIENANRYGKGSLIEISAHAINATELEISVGDRGPGIPAGERDRIFEAFYRMPGTREGNGGVGLGLALVQSIAQIHGGKAYCSDRPGGGSLFIVRLPIK